MGTWKRWLISLGGGFLLPALYIGVSSILAQFIKNETIMQFIYIPVTWPNSIYDYFKPPAGNYFYTPSGPGEFTLFRGYEMKVISFIAGNVALYALISYALLYRRVKSDKYNERPTQNY